MRINRGPRHRCAACLEFASASRARGAAAALTLARPRATNTERGQSNADTTGATATSLTTPIAPRDTVFGGRGRPSLKRLPLDARLSLHSRLPHATRPLHPLGQDSSLFDCVAGEPHWPTFNRPA